LGANISAKFTIINLVFFKNFSFPTIDCGLTFKANAQVSRAFLTVPFWSWSNKNNWNLIKQSLPPDISLNFKPINTYHIYIQKKV